MAVLSDFLLKVLLGVVDGVVGSGTLGQLGLLLGGDGGVDVYADALEHLDEPEAHASGAGVDQDMVALAEMGDPVDEEVGGHALQHGGCGGVVVHAIGDAYEEPRGDGVDLGVAAGVHGVGHAVADGHLGDALADGSHHPGGLAAWGPGEGVGRVGALAAGDVGVVDADGLDLDEGLAGCGRRLGRVLVVEHLGPAGLVDADGLHGCRLLGWVVCQWIIE